MENIRIGDVLIEAGFISEMQLGEALAYQKEHKDEKKRLGTVLIEQGLVTDAQMKYAIAKRLDLDTIDLQNTSVSQEAVAKIPEKIAKQYGMIGADIDNDVLILAVSDPLDFYGIEDIRQIAKMRIKVVVDTKEHIEAAIDENYSEITANVALKRASQLINVELSTNEENIDDDDDAPVVHALNQLLVHGFTMGASDIHIEPFENDVVVRVRLDGVITEMARLPKNIHLPLIARIKIMADMDIAERRTPQDGNFSVKLEGNKINARVSMVPTVTGEKAVIRFLFENIAVDSASHFGMDNENYGKFKKLLEAPHGMIYISGPTGSGKTTTLYMVLEAMQKRPINIETIEDPVERSLDGIAQMQVNNLAGLSFESGLRALLRQDPDVIMIGETRDTETAEIAVRAAITGHVVFSTIHTNDAVSAVIRLQDMGIPAYLVANSLTGLVAQRLIRKICPGCKTRYEASEAEAKLFGKDKMTLYRGVGCSMCNGTGYKGRIAVHEVAEIDKNIRRLIAAKAEASVLEDALRKTQNFETLQEAALKLVESGITTIDEFYKIAYYSD